jgi:hypothetical protein
MEKPNLNFCQTKFETKEDECAFYDIEYLRAYNFEIRANH